MMSGQTSHSVTSSRQDKAILRAIVQEDVLKMTRLRRSAIWAALVAEHPDWDEPTTQAEVDRLQPEYAEYDPVVAMAVMSANHEYPVDVRLRAMAESAQYLRPKLKSIEMVVDPLSPEEQEVRRALAARLVGLLDAGAAAKRATVVEGVARDVGAAPPGVGPDDKDQAAEDPDDGGAGVADRG